MGWRLSSWLALARSCQLMGSGAAVGLHGYLTIRVYKEKMGITEHMVALELLICAILGYTTLALFLQRTGRRSKNTSWHAGFVVCDALSCGAVLAIITLLARAGLPVHCEGMTEDNGPWVQHSYHFDESDGINKYMVYPGELENLCNFERSYFAISIVLVFTYILTIVLTMLRILDHYYTKNSKVTELLDSLDRAEEAKLKTMDMPSPLPRSPSLDTHPLQPLSEGVMTRNTSLRSTFTTMSSTSTNPYRAYSIPRRPVNQPPPSMPQAPVGLALRIPLHPDEDDSAADAALVTDGMQHHRRSSSRDIHHHQPRTLPILSEEDQHQTANAALVSDGMQHHHHHRQPSHPPYQHPHHSSPRMLPMLSEEGHHTAGAALVSDGIRPCEPTLPPYHPGSTRMGGHGGEDNEMRLSEYVKGGTRAQDMKDSGGF